MCSRGTLVDIHGSISSHKLAAARVRCDGGLAYNELCPRSYLGHANSIFSSGQKRHSPSVVLSVVRIAASQLRKIVNTIRFYSLFDLLLRSFEHCTWSNVVPEKGLEPPRLAAVDFESIASTIPPLGHERVFMRLM